MSFLKNKGFTKGLRVNLDAHRDTSPFDGECNISFTDAELSMLLDLFYQWHRSCSMILTDPKLLSEEREETLKHADQIEYLYDRVMKDLKLFTKEKREDLN